MFDIVIIVIEGNKALLLCVTEDTWNNIVMYYLYGKKHDSPSHNYDIKS